MAPGFKPVPKPQPPYSAWVRRFLHHVLSDATYRRYVGRHEDASTRLWRSFASRVSASHAILDIGAFQGEYALAARDVNPSASIYAFEPNPHNLERLRPICRGKNIRVLPEAVSDRSGTVTFLCSSAQSRIDDRATGEHEEACQVPAVTLESFVTNHQVVPALIKIDVEGSEPVILLAAKSLLARFVPVILCEVLTDAAGSQLMSALPSNYTFWHIDENKSATRRDHITRREWRNKNYLFVPKSRCSEMADTVGCSP